MFGLEMLSKKLLRFLKIDNTTKTNLLVRAVMSSIASPFYD